MTTTRSDGTLGRIHRLGGLPALIGLILATVTPQRAEAWVLPVGIGVLGGLWLAGGNDREAYAEGVAAGGAVGVSLVGAILLGLQARAEAAQRRAAERAERKRAAGERRERRAIPGDSANGRQHHATEGRLTLGFRDPARSHTGQEAVWLTVDRPDAHSQSPMTATLLCRTGGSMGTAELSVSVGEGVTITSDMALRIRTHENGRAGQWIRAEPDGGGTIRSLSVPWRSLDPMAERWAIELGRASHAKGLDVRTLNRIELDGLTPNERSLRRTLERACTSGLPRLAARATDAADAWLTGLRRAQADGHPRWANPLDGGADRFVASLPLPPGTIQEGWHDISQRHHDDVEKMARRTVIGGFEKYERSPKHYMPHELERRWFRYHVGRLRALEDPREDRILVGEDRPTVTDADHLMIALLRLHRSGPAVAMRQALRAEATLRASDAGSGIQALDDLIRAPVDRLAEPMVRAAAAHERLAAEALAPLVRRAFDPGDGIDPNPYARGSAGIAIAHVLAAQALHQDVFEVTWAEGRAGNIQIRFGGETHVVFTNGAGRITDIGPATGRDGASLAQVTRRIRAEQG